MNEREHRCSRLFSAPVAVAVTSIEHLSDLEAHRIAGTPASQENTHGGLHRILFDLQLHHTPILRSLSGVDRRARRVKTDRIDAERLLRSLMAYLRGEPKVWSAVRVPSVAEEDARRLHRERDRLVLERVRHVNRKGRTTGIELAWLWLRYQPDSDLSIWFRARVGTMKGRIRRIAIVALARKLLVALWRYLETGLVPRGAVLKG